MFKFKVIKKDSSSRARIGKIITPRGVIETPVFMPVGTQGSIKAMPLNIVASMGYKIILSNTYHLYLRPGEEIIHQLGGLHKFIGWERLILTDSGGFQVYSLSQFRKITEDGVIFKSHLDGSEHFLTPVKAIQIQEKLGSDIMMVLDTCIPYPSSEEETQYLTNLTYKWAKISKKYWDKSKNPKQALFGIVQGGMFSQLRKENALKLVELNFDGYAIGGLSVGEPFSLRLEMTGLTTEVLPENKPRYLMGIGTPVDIVEAVSLGVDMFDCVLPTRNARRASLFTSEGVINLRNAKYKDDPLPIDPTCDCPVCQTYSRAYLRHLFQAKELLCYHLFTLHNLYFFSKFMEHLKKAILTKTFDNFKKEVYQTFRQDEKEE